MGVVQWLDARQKPCFTTGQEDTEAKGSKTNLQEKGITFHTALVPIGQTARAGVQPKVEVVAKHRRLRTQAPRPAQLHFQPSCLLIRGPEVPGNGVKTHQPEAVPTS